MTIETHLNSILEHFLFTEAREYEITAAQLIHVIDLTLLKENAAENELNHINRLAQTYPVAAVCIYSHHINYFKSQNKINFATVINFPHGNESLKNCVQQIDRAIQLGVTEIDYVFPYQIYLSQRKEEALAHSLAIAQYCEQKDCTLKIIIETGAFSEMHSIYQLCCELLASKCDFLKTSTGKIPQGASLPAAFAILSAIKDSAKPCGIKISGGVKTPQQARNFACLAELMMHKTISKDWFRIGASSLLEELLNT